MGYEIDPLILSKLDSGIKEDVSLELLNQDYLKSEPNPYDSIICNPPYLRFQKFKDRHTILPKLQKELGIKISGLTNIASVFLMKSLAQLKQGGRLAYIMPYEFLNAGYGTPLKRILLEQNLLHSIIFFENEKEIFPDAITTVCVLLCQKQYASNSILVTSIKSRTELEAISFFEELPSLSVEKSRLDFTKKWSPILEEIASNTASIPHGFYSFSFYGAFKRGIATGANEFFALSYPQIQKLQIPLHQTTRCITKSTQLRRCILDPSTLERLIEEGAEVFCLDAKAPFDCFTQQYLATGEAKDFHKRFLTRSRTPWYKIETRTVSPLFIGVFYRERIKVIRNYASCIHFTCYHSFYPNSIGTPLLDKIFLYLMSDFGQQFLKRNRRRYGDGLDKFEPQDLNQCAVPSPALFESLKTDSVCSTLEKIKKTPDIAIALANELIYFWLNPLL